MHPAGTGSAPLRLARDVVEYRTREVPLLVALFIGAVPLLVALQLLVSSVAALRFGVGAALPTLLAAVFFAAIGLPLFAARRSAVVDRAAKTLTVRWGKGVRLPPKTLPLDPSAVTLVDRRRRTRGWLHQCFVLAADGQRLLVWESPFEDSTRQAASELEAFLRGEEPWASPSDGRA